jgi:putative phosphoesterase
VRIAVVSDTHLPRFGRTLPRALTGAIRAADVDLILHLGDFTSVLAADLLGELAPFDGVAGNNDGPELVERFGRRKVVTLEGVRIGLTHGDLGVGASTAERAWRAFADDAVDAVLFGHSHIPLLQRRGGTLLLNPGSPTDKRRQRRFSYAIAEIDDGRITAQLHTFEDGTLEG